MVLQIIDKDFTIFKTKELPAHLLQNEFTFVSKTDKELSVICESQNIPDEVLIPEEGWKCFRIAEDAPFEKYGMIAFLADIIAAQNTSTLVVATYDTDYFFIKKEKFGQVIQALKNNDCIFV